ncbi:unnamed protein product [Phytophthora fragariaefolia]|uniref:Unnamed protein product n=1 Tax=Phytophthora fragariaefolia TaxID=1490495 RepID=A0A9W6Y6S0_9STRA|nr:unnamed protein product [Phytophthora fragariaefolia]
MIEKAVGEDIKLEEIERFFPDDPSKKPMPSQQKNRHDASSTSDVRLSELLVAISASKVLTDMLCLRFRWGILQEFAPPSKKKRGGGGAGGSQGPGTGVCYDFQNKGVCQRGRFCHFSHCACNSTCSCTPTKNTYGQRPSYRRNDYDAPPSPEVPPSSIADVTPAPDKAPSLRHANSFERDSSLKNDGAGGEEEEAGELTDNSTLPLFGTRTMTCGFQLIFYFALCTARQRAH